MEQLKDAIVEILKEKLEKKHVKLDFDSRDEYVTVKIEINSSVIDEYMKNRNIEKTNIREEYGF